MIRLALYQPDIPQNVGAAMRLCACLGLGMDIIEPCGFAWDERKIRIAAMDYYNSARLIRHTSWDIFLRAQSGRVVLLTTKTDRPYYDFAFRKGDILLVGRESAGVPKDVHAACPERLTIPMAPDQRSLNVVTAAAMVAGEAIRQSRQFNL